MFVTIFWNSLALILAIMIVGYVCYRLFHR